MSDSSSLVDRRLGTVGSLERLRGRVALYALVPGLLLIDVLNGALFPPGVRGGAPTAAAQVSPGTLVRGFLTVLAVLLVILSRESALKPMRRAFLLLAVAGLAGPFVGLARGGSIHDLLANLMALSKILYAPGMVVVFSALVRRTGLNFQDVLSAIASAGALASLLLCVTDVLGVGTATYLLQHAGFKGLFISQNEIGLTMGLALFASVQLALSTRRLRYVLLVLATVPGMLLLGTRAAALGVFIAPILVLMVNTRRLLRGRSSVVHIALAVVMFVAVGVGGVWEANMLQNQQFEQGKFRAIVSQDVVLVRGYLVIGAVRYIATRPATVNVLGEGSVRYEHGVAAILRLPYASKAAEVDWLDILGAYGIVFVCLLYAYYGRFFWLSRHVADLYGRPIRLTVVLMLGWMLAHSIVAGHAVGPMPAGTLAPLLAYVWLHREADALASRQSRSASQAARVVD